MGGLPQGLHFKHVKAEFYNDLYAGSMVRGLAWLPTPGSVVCGPVCLETNSPLRHVRNQAAARGRAGMVMATQAYQMRKMNNTCLIGHDVNLGFCHKSLFWATCFT